MVDSSWTDVVLSLVWWVSGFWFDVVYGCDGILGVWVISVTFDFGCGWFLRINSVWSLLVVVI